MLDLNATGSLSQKRSICAYHFILESCEWSRFARTVQNAQSEYVTRQVDRMKSVKVRDIVLQCFIIFGEH